MKRSFPFRYGYIILLLMWSMFFSNCNPDEKCKGCDKDTPWSNLEADYCYPTKGQCETMEGSECERCD